MLHKSYKRQCIDVSCSETKVRHGRNKRKTKNSHLDRRKNHDITATKLRYDQTSASEKTERRPPASTDTGRTPSAPVLVCA